MKSTLTKIGLALLMILVMTACTDNSKPTSEVTLEQVQEDAIALAFIQAKFEKVVSLEIVSAPVQENQCLVVANITYDNGDANVSGQVVINYEWSNKAWHNVHTQFSFTAVSVKTEPTDSEILKGIDLFDPVDAQFEAGSFSTAPVIEARDLNLEIGEATYTISQESAVENWSSKITATVKAKYYYLEGWKFTLENWSYREQTDWKGTWTIQWATYDNETQYQPNEKMTLTVSGQMIMTKNSAGDQNEDRNVSITFKRSGNSYVIPPLISSDYQDEGRYTTRFIVLKYGNQANDQFNMELRFDLESSTPTTSFVAKSYNGNFGILTKIK